MMRRSKGEQRLAARRSGSSLTVAGVEQLNSRAHQWAAVPWSAAWSAASAASAAARSASTGETRGTAW